MIRIAHNRISLLCLELFLLWRRLRRVPGWGDG